MAKFVAVSREAHAQKVWRRFSNYQFAAKEALAPIVLAEVVQVGSWMPIVFIEEAGRYVLMAMMSPMPGHNLFVGPDGEWLGGYAPSSLRTHPFRLVRREGSEQMTLYIDEDSGVIRNANEAGEPFFAADGKPSPSISTIVEFLRQIEADRVATDLATVSLGAAGVIEPWPLEVEVGGKKAATKGLHRINELALNCRSSYGIFQQRGMIAGIEDHAGRAHHGLRREQCRDVAGQADLYAAFGERLPDV